MKEYRKYIVLSMAMVISYFASIFIYMPILSVYAQSLGASVATIGLLGGAYGVMQVLFRIPAGIYSDKIQKQKVFISSGMAFALVSSVVLFFANSPGSLMVGRMITGVSMVTWVIIITQFISYFPPEKASRASGIVIACSAVGQMIGTGLGGSLFSGIGETAPFLFSMVFSGIALVMTFFLKETKPARAPMTGGQLVRVGRQPNVLVYCVLAGVLHFIMFAATFTFTPVIVKGLGASATDNSVMTFTYTAATMIGSLMVGTVIKARHEKKAMGVVLIFLAISTGMTPFIRSVGVLTGLEAVNGFSRGLAFAAVSALTVKGVKTDARATATGFLHSFAALGVLFGPVVSGLLIEWISVEFAYLFMTAALLATVGAFVIMRTQIAAVEARVAAENGAREDEKAVTEGEARALEISE